VLDSDTVATLAARVLAEEHRAYPEAVKIVLDEAWTVEGRRFLRPVRAGEVSGVRPQGGN
jgi:phosphoribosylglycinamide formyltransferase-1